MKYLKWYNSEFLGIVGEPTDMTYEDGSNIYIGDIIEINIGNRYNVIDLLVTKDGIVGFYGIKFINGSVTKGLTYTIKNYNNEHLETKSENISMHEATIHDIAVKCTKVDEKFNTIKIMQRLNGEKESTVGFSKDLLCNYITLNDIKETKAWTEVDCKKIIIDYPTFIQHFDNTKLEVEIKQIDNVVMNRLVKGDKNLLGYSFNCYPLWHSQNFYSIDNATKYVEELQSKINEINNPQHKYFDSLGQELHEGDDVEYMIKEAFSQGLLSGRLEMFNGKLTIDKFITLPEEIDNTKLYIRKVNN